MARRRAVALALGLIALAAIVPALAAVGPPPGGVHAQPVLGVADPETQLMGSEEDGTTWGYRELPATVPGGGELGFLRWTPGDGWRYVERAEVPLGPNRRSARVTPKGGALLVGDDRRSGVQTPVVLVRDPGAPFRALPSPDGVLEPGEALAADGGAGRAAVAAYDADGSTGAFFAAVGPASENAIMHWDGETWTREPVEVPAALAASFRIVAVSATGSGNAWMTARTDPAADRGLSLFQRVTGGAGSRWVERDVGAAAFAHRADLSRGISEVEVLNGDAQSLTATEDGVWIDGTLRTDADGGRSHTFTLFFDLVRGGAVTGSWCDALDLEGAGICDAPLGVRLSGQFGYQSFAWPGEGFGTRIVTNPLDPSGDGETNRGTYLRLQEGAFQRMPGAGGNFRPGGAFSSPDEGWLEGPVHITRHPEPEHLRDSWPVAARAPLAAVATEPGRTPGDLGSGALAAGPDGTVLRYKPGEGWSREFLLSSAGSVVRSTLRGVAWPEASRAHAVGDLGAMWLWRGETGLWERDPGAPIGYEANLMDVAFQPGNPDRGYAVGKGGALLSYQKGWLQEELPPGSAAEDLTQIAFAGSQAIVAAGSNLLVNEGGGWRVDGDAARLLDQLPGDPQLFAVAALPDGGAVAAGREIVIERDSGGGPWRFSDQPLAGLTGVAAAAFREGGRVQAVLSVMRLGAGRTYPPVDDPGEPDPNVPPPILPAFPLPADGFVLRETSTGWRDEQHTAYAGSGDDRPVKSDPILDFALGAGGTGWAVGGWSGEQDVAGNGSSARGGAGRTDRTRVQTAAVFRYGDEGQPPPGAAQAEIPLPAGRARFAVAGHAACESACVDLPLQDIRPDRSLAAVLAKVTALRSQPGGPRMLLYTGGRLAPGLDGSTSARETSRYASLLASQPLPVFPAVSSTDAGAGTTYFRHSFSAFGAPFGAGPAAPGVDPSHTGGTPPGPGARTHYAFDSFGPEGAVRVIVIDNSAGSLEASDAHQNPLEPQRPWLAAVLADAKGRGIPAIVVGSRDLNSRFIPRLNTATDGDETARLLVEGGASAYFFERPEENRTYQLSGGAAGSIPAFGTGTLGYRSNVSDQTNPTAPNSLFGDSGYLLAEVDVGGRDNLTNRAPVSVRMMPLIDDLSIQAVDGTLLRRSRPALFQGLGRRPIAGDRWRPLSGGNADPAGSDPYVSFPAPPCLQAGCSTLMQAEYEFLSSDPDIGDFVRQDPNSTNLRKPLLGVDDKPITDNRSGLFCAFNAGVTTVTVRAGGLSYSQQVRILPGSVQRPCGTRPLRPDRFRRPAAPGAAAPPPAAPQGGNEPPVSFDPPPPPAAQPPGSPTAAAAKAPITFSPFIPISEPLAFLPPTPLPVPAPVLRPTPPSGGFGRAFERQREDEVAPEEMQAAARLHQSDQGFPAGYLLAAMVLAALAGATIFGGPRSHERVRAAPAYARRGSGARRP